MNEPVGLDLGLTAKFIPSSAVTVDLAINPDFAQVEADQLVVTANQRFPIFFPEKRPFFLEGIDIFQTPITAVHTRAIVDPDVAVKTTGKKGRNTFGLMVASDNGPGNFSADDRGALNACLERRALDPRVDLQQRTLPRQERLHRRAATQARRRQRKLARHGRDELQLHRETQPGAGNRRSLSSRQANDRELPDTRNNLAQLLFRSKRRRKRVIAPATALVIPPITTFPAATGVGKLYGEGFTQDYRADVGFVQRTNSNFNFGFLRYNSDPNPKKKIISYHIHNVYPRRLRLAGPDVHLGSREPRRVAVAAQQLGGRVVGAGIRAVVRSRVWANARSETVQSVFGSTNKCTFYGESNERASDKQHLSFYAGSNFSKKIQFNGQVTHRWGHFDLDFGNGRQVSAR